MKGVINFLSGLILGGLVGATLAILLAPESGEELRGEIRERVESIQAEVNRAANERRAELEKELAGLRRTY
jgi:gas vesicle protein